jgi:hypothetical protein
VALTPATRARARVDPFVIALPAAALAVAVWDPARNGGPPLCPFRGLTGVPCPGCGLTRAAGALLRGRVTDALHVHPLIPLAVAQLLVVWLLLTFGRDRLQRLPGWVVPAVVSANVVVFCGVWIARLATGSLDA